MKTFWWLDSAEILTDINLITIPFNLKFFYGFHCSLNKVLYSYFCGLRSLSTFYAGPLVLSPPVTSPSFNLSKCLSPFCSQALCIYWPVPWWLPNPLNTFAYLVIAHFPVLSSGSLCFPRPRLKPLVVCSHITLLHTLQLWLVANLLDFKNYVCFPH